MKPWRRVPFISEKGKMRSKGEKMIVWEYMITIHEIPKIKESPDRIRIECDQVGQCLVHDTFRGGREWLEKILREKGEEGWELVQLGHHYQELLCIWKRRKEVSQKD